VLTLLGKEKMIYPSEHHRTPVRKSLVTLWVRSAIAWAVLICLGAWLGKTAMTITAVIVIPSAGRMIDNLLCKLVISMYVSGARVGIAGLAVVWGLLLSLTWRLVVLSLATGTLLTIILWMALYYVSWIEVVSQEPNPVVRASIWTSGVYTCGTILWYLIL
jgi:hypothetical protein